MTAAVLLAVLLIVASDDSRGAGLILLGLLLYSRPRVFAGFLILLGMLWLFRR
jgi:hypothetical protein